MSFLFKNYSLVKSFDGKSQSFDGSSDTSGSTVSVPTSENITNLEIKINVTIWWVNKGMIKCKECDHWKSASWEWAFKRKIL